MPPGCCPGYERPLPATLPSARRVKTSGLYPEQTSSSKPNPHYSDIKKTARRTGIPLAVVLVVLVVLAVMVVGGVSNNITDYVFYIFSNLILTITL